MRTLGFYVVLLCLAAMGVVGCGGDREGQRRADSVKEPVLFDSSGVPVVRNILDSVFQDPRDSRVYKTVKYGNQVWMAENLKYTGKEILADSEGMPLVWAAENKDECGFFYHWKIAKKACPPGWRLPMDDDWISLRRYLSRCGIKRKRERNALGDSVDLEIDSCLTDLRGDSLRASSDLDYRGRPYPDYYGFSAKKCNVIEEFSWRHAQKDGSSPSIYGGAYVRKGRIPRGNPNSEWWASDEFGDPLMWILSDRLERPFRGGKPDVAEIPTKFETIRCVQGDPVKFKVKDTIDLRNMRPHFNDPDNELLYDALDDIDDD